MASAKTRAYASHSCLIKAATLIGIDAEEAAPDRLIQHLVTTDLLVAVGVKFLASIGPEFHGVDQFGVGTVGPAEHVEHLVGLGGYRDRDARQSVDPPAFLAAGHVVTHQLPRASDDHLIDSVDLANHRCRVASREALASRLPNLLAGLAIQGQEKRVDVVVFVQDQQLAGKHGRTVGSVFVLERPQLVFPNVVASKIVAEQTVAAEINVDPLTIAGGSTRCRAAGLVVALQIVYHHGAPPAQLAGLPIERQRRQLVAFVGRHENQFVGYTGRRVSGTERLAPEVICLATEIGGELTGIVGRDTAMTAEVGDCLVGKQHRAQRCNDDRQQNGTRLHR